MLGSSHNDEKYTGPVEAVEGTNNANTGLAGEIFHGLLDECIELSEGADVNDNSNAGMLAKLYFRVSPLEKLRHGTFRFMPKTHLVFFVVAVPPR